MFLFKQDSDSLYCVVYVGIKGKVVKLCRWIKFGQCDVRVPGTTKHLAPCIARFSFSVYIELPVSKVDWFSSHTEVLFFFAI